MEKISGMNLGPLTKVLSISFYFVSLVLVIGFIVIPNFNFSILISLSLLKILSLILLISHIFVNNLENITPFRLFLKLYLIGILIGFIVFHLLLSIKFNQIKDINLIYNYYSKFEKISLVLLTISASALIFINLNSTNDKTIVTGLNIISWFFFIISAFLYYLKDKIYNYYITDG